MLLLVALGYHPTALDRMQHGEAGELVLNDNVHVRETFNGATPGPEPWESTGPWFVDVGCHVIVCSGRYYPPTSCFYEKILSLFTRRGIDVSDRDDVDCSVHMLHVDGDVVGKAWTITTGSTRFIASRYGSAEFMRGHTCGPWKPDELAAEAWM